MDEDGQKVALVTGASSGIGLAIAKRLRDSGYRVFGTSRKAGVNSLDGITMLTCDVTDNKSVVSAIGQAIDMAGRIDILINNAGIGLFGGAQESSAEQVQTIFDTNLFGVVRMTNAVLPTMQKQGQGRIVNISSVLGFVPAPYSAIYASTKHALEGYSESLDHEVRGDGIRVVLVQPAYTKTSFDQNTVIPDTMMPRYDRPRANLTELIAKVMKNADDPTVVADVVLKAILKRNPKRRYPAGKVATQLSFVRRLMPSALFDKILRSQLGMKA